MRALLPLLCVAALSPFACQGGAADTVVDPDVIALLEAVGPEVVRPAVAMFRARAVDLQVATAAWTEGQTVDVQAAWRAAFLAWQPLEVMQIGPLGSSLDAVGGADLRDAVYSWPAVSRCEVDRVTARGGWDDADFFATALVPVQGLDALETLIFSPPGQTSCLGSVDIVRDGSWAALGEEGVQTRRAAYAAALVSHLVDLADQIDQAWAPEGGDWSHVLATAGQASSPYRSVDDALDAVFHGLFYLETEVKDRKLGKVLGRVDCEVASCPEDVEATLAGVSVEAISANLDGFDALFHGGAATGMDELLTGRGFDDVRVAVQDALAGARGAVAAVRAPLDQDAGDPAAIAAFEAVKGLTDLVKGDLATTLTLQIPSDADGDAD